MKIQCAVCAKEMKRPPSGLTPSGENYCSRECYRNSGRRRGAPSAKIAKKCESCGADFFVFPVHKSAKFCSIKCKGVGSRSAEKPCDFCGKMFRSRKGGRYCTIECSQQGKRNGKTISCVQCGNSFYATKNRGKAKCCSTACANMYQRRNKIEHTCILCGKVFRKSPAFSKWDNVKYCSQKCYHEDPQVKKRLIEMNMKQQEISPTKLERAGYALLDDLGIKYIPQHVIGEKFCVDAFVPEHKIVIQFDGDYWHGHPLRFPIPDKRQKRRMALDLSQDAYMAACGYSVIRIWESDIKKSVHLVRQNLIHRISISETTG